MFSRNASVKKSSFGVPYQEMNSLSEGTCWPKYPLQDRDQSRNGPQYVIDYPCHNSENLPERFRIAPRLVNSEENNPVLTKRLKIDILLW